MSTAKSTARWPSRIRPGKDAIAALAIIGIPFAANRGWSAVADVGVPCVSLNRGRYVRVPMCSDTPKEWSVVDSVCTSDVKEFHSHPLQYHFLQFLSSRKQHKGNVWFSHTTQHNLHHYSSQWLPFVCTTIRPGINATAVDHGVFPQATEP